MEFRSGILGCLICLVALVGSIFVPAVLNGESVEVPVTDYSYVTDLTGTFSTTDAPEYIDYNPAANYTGYTVGSVNYTSSATPNAYRYVASYPDDQTVNRTYTASTTIGGTTTFNPSELVTKALINYTGADYNFGTSVTSDGLTYNAYAATYSIPQQHINYPLVAKLSSIIHDVFQSYADGSGNVEINISHGGTYPLIFVDRNTYTHRTISDGDSNIWYIYQANVSAVPTKIIWNVNTNYTTVYNGSTILFTGNAETDIDVYYRYYYMNGNTHLVANVSTLFTYRYSNAVSTTVTSNSSYPNYNPQNTHDLYINNTVSIGALPTTPYGSELGYNYNMFLTYNSSNRGITKLSNILSTMNLPTNTEMYINITNNNLPDPSIMLGNDPAIFCYSQFTDISATGDWVETTKANFPYMIHLATNGQVTIYYHPSGNNQSVQAYSGSPDNVYVIYKYYYDGYNSDVSTTFSTSYEMTEDMVINNNSHISSSNLRPFNASTGGTMALMSWNGSYNMGVGGIYNGMSYNMEAKQTNTSGGLIPDVWTLESLLISMGLDGYNTVDINISGNDDYPVLFYYGGWTMNTITYGSTVQYVYSATLNENNSMPDHISIAGSTVRAYKNNILIYTASVTDVYIINKYQINTNGSGLNDVSTYAHLVGYASRDSDPVTTTVNNSSSYPSDAYGFANPGGSMIDTRYLLPYLNYTGTEYNNLGTSFDITAISKNATICLTSNTSNNFTTYSTKLTNIINAIGIANRDSLDVSLTYGTHPVIFLKGNWEYYNRDSSYHDQGGSVRYYYNYYWNTIDDNAFPDRMTYNTATDLAVFYKNGHEIWNAPASQVQVVYKYWILTPSGTPNVPTYTAVTDQSVTMTGTAKLRPTYGYANPSYGVTIKNGFTTWSNGYQNNVINILWAEDNTTAINDLTISVGTSVFTITRLLNNTVNVSLTKANGTTESASFGNWHGGQITINATDGTISLTPITNTSRLNFTDEPIPLSSITTTWYGWYTGEPIEEIVFSNTNASMRFGVTSTTVFLNTYGVVMFDPSINIQEYFPDMDEWRLNFYSFALLGDSMTVNGVTYPVNPADGTITVTDVETRKSTTGTLNNVYLTRQYDTLYLTFGNTDKTVNLGTITDNAISFSGMWYFTTGLYEVTEKLDTVWNWNIWSLNIDIGNICLFFIIFVIIGLIIGKGVFKVELSVIDWIILILGVFISLIIAGGYYL